MENNSEEVIKYDHKEHVLKVSDTYVGSVEPTSEEHYILVNKKTENSGNETDENNEESSPELMMKKSNITFTPGEYKIFDEIVVNCVDQVVRTNQKIREGDASQIPVKNIKINFDREEGFISVMNDGEGIPVKIHGKEKIYIPELIFGHLLTSANYEKKNKTTGGKNGYGAKLANIFSLKFVVETIDHRTGKKYIQEFTDNMSNVGKPKITSNKGKPYTKITYYPDFKRFGHKENKLSDDMIKLITKRTYDISAVTHSSVNVFLNGNKIEYKSFEKYTDLYLGSDRDEVPRVYQEFGERWSICVAINPNQSFEQVSFVNGITTYQGGKHVDYIVNQLCKKLTEYTEKKKKIKVKTSSFKENIMVFVKSTINDPSFTSQVKEFLTTPASKFGSKCDMDTKFIDRVAKMGLMDLAINLNNFKDNKDLKKTDGKKKGTIRGIPKLDDANWAGGPKSHECTLILTEGDSAKTLAISGLSVIGRDKYGVFPLKGKPLNVKGEDMIKKIGDNVEISNLKKILGLVSGMKYTDRKQLRYGSIMVMADQDEDGSHIKGLLFNVFQSLWPELFKMEGFNKSMLTPIVKASKGAQIHSFYNLGDYEQWKETNNSGKGWHIKYYKGLGTSTPKEAKEYFRNMKLVNYVFEDIKSDEAIELAFNKTRADDRKKWLADYDRYNVLDYSNENVTHTDFINKELIHFSNSDNKRSIPSVIDGLKTSHRKILFCAFKKKLNKEIKVAQFAGYVSEHGGYHHGEASLMGSIVNMSQDYISSNNINLLEPIGQFGSRIEGGHDSAQPRYIFTKLPPIITKIFNPDDNKILNYLDDDGFMVEPDSYIPIIPMILVNGTKGIGTGWSTFVPSYNPRDIISNIKRKIKGEEMIEMVPWYRNFKGNIEEVSKNMYISRGIYNSINDNTVIIEELPIKTWTDEYKADLESLIIETGKDKDKKKKYLRNYNSYCSDTAVKFELTFNRDIKSKLMKINVQKSNSKNKDYCRNNFEKVFKMVSKINCTNMVLYDANGKLKKYKSTLEIIDDYYEVRFKYYGLRKTNMLNNLEKELLVLNAKIRFIMEFIEGKIVISNRTKKNLIEQLEQGDYPKIGQNGSGGGEEENYTGNYDYLIKMPIYNLTKDKIDELNKENDIKSKMFKDIEGKTLEFMYLEDLEDLLLEYDKFEKDKVSKLDDPIKKKKVTKGKGTKVSKDSTGLKKKINKKKK